MTARYATYGWGHAPRRAGVTLTELLVAIAIFVLILGLLGFPLYTAFGYIQKAIAQGEAQDAGKRAVQQLSAEISEASEIYPVPSTGEWVALINGNNTAVVMELASSSATTVRMVRYQKVLDFPWVYDAPSQAWKLLRPNYDANGDDRYDKFYRPFHQQGEGEFGLNPYILGRFEESGLSWASATVFALDGSYPMTRNDFQQLMPDPTPDKRNRAVLQRLFRNWVNSLTPLGPEWDVSLFKVTPQRQMTEVLARVNTNGLPVAVTAGSPLIAGRNQDIDAVDEAYQDGILNETLYHVPVNTLSSAINIGFPLYRMGQNPFGYRVRVYNGAGGTAYGVYADMTAVVNQVVCQRHYMDWPAIDRPDLLNVSKDNFQHDSFLARWIADVARHRREGKLVFEQPMRMPSIKVGTAADENGGALLAGELRIPELADLPNVTHKLGWNAELTYLATPGQTLTLRNVSNQTETFTLVTVDKLSKLQPGQFCYFYRGKITTVATLDVGDGPKDINATRVIFFRSGKGLAAGVHQASGQPVFNAAAPYQYTICDLQPTDTVVATYSTNGILNVGLTLNRQDRSGAKLESSRQSYAVNLRLEARNALRRARSGE